jgi:hypothetical protein
MTATIRERSFKNKSRLRPADRDLSTGAGFDETDHAHLLDGSAQADAVPVRPHRRFLARTGLDLTPFRNLHN